MHCFLQLRNNSKNIYLGVDIVNWMVNNYTPMEGFPYTSFEPQDKEEDLVIFLEENVHRMPISEIYRRMICCQNTLFEREEERGHISRKSGEYYIFPPNQEQMISAMEIMRVKLSGELERRGMFRD
jgi:hypothetical protein